MNTPSEQTSASARSKLAEVRAIGRRDGDAAAEAALAEMLQEEPNSPDLLMGMARLLNRQKRFEEAEKAIEKAIALAPFNPKLPVLAGFIQIRREQPARAAEFFAEAVRLDPNSAEALLGLATVQMLEEDYETALRFCDRALDINSSLDRAYELVARINHRQGRTDLALAELKGILEDDPTNQRVVRAYLRLLRKEERNEEAVAFLEKAVGNDPDPKELSKVARLAMRSGQADFAVRQYRNLLGGGSKRRIDRVRFVIALIESGAIEEAEAEIEALGKMRGMKPAVHVLKGEIARKQGDLEGAIRRYRKGCSAIATATATPDPATTEGSPEGTLEERVESWRKRALAQVRNAVRQQRNERQAAAGRTGPTRAPQGT